MATIKKISVGGTTYDLNDTRITGVDSTPTASSGNVVTSGGVKTALDGKVAKAGDTMTGDLQINTNLLLYHSSNDSSWQGVITSNAVNGLVMASPLRNSNKTPIFIGWRNVSTPAIIVDSSARVGIGMSSPTCALDVTGDIQSTGDIRAKGNDLYVGSASNAQCHQQYDATNKCLKFIFD